jgi:O-methyltransferase
MLTELAADAPRTLDRRDDRHLAFRVGRIGGLHRPQWLHDARKRSVPCTAAMLPASDLDGVLLSFSQPSMPNLGELELIKRLLKRVVRTASNQRRSFVRRLFGAERIPLRLGRVEGRPDLLVGCVPARFQENYDKYRTRGYAYSEKSERAFIFCNIERNAGDLSRFYFLALVCDLVDKEQLRGDIAELGVYKGNTAFLFAELARRGGRTAYLFDTFESLPERDFVGVDSDKKNWQRDFEDTSVSAVQSLIGNEGVVVIPGYFPETAATLPGGTVFAIVHLDCDLYAPTRAGLEFFYPKLVSGGFLVIHDYSSLYWDGVEKAVDEFFADKAERIVPIPDRAGTVVIRKL